jgi:3-hydroxybutyryl-CoA dehydrogenase
LGIALVAAQKAGVPVTLVDTNQASIDKGLKFAGELVFPSVSLQSPLTGHYSDKLLAKDVSKERITQEQSNKIRSLLAPTTSMDSLADVDFVIEAVPEILTLKFSIFESLAQICPPHAILATNTSSISITRIAAATTKDPTDTSASSRVI